jgi:hypothetical protein
VALLPHPEPLNNSFRSRQASCRSVNELADRRGSRRGDRLGGEWPGLSPSSLVLGNGPGFTGSAHALDNGRSIGHRSGLQHVELVY